MYDLHVHLLESGHMEAQSKYLSKLLECFEHKPDMEYSVVISKGEEKKITWKDLENECQSIMNSLNSFYQHPQ